MKSKTVQGECSSCESSYVVDYTEEFVSKDEPEHCPFCGEVIDDLEDITSDVDGDEDSVGFIPEEWD
jgi:NAD-dependent SIR2 family protein deacetylase